MSHGVVYSAESQCSGKRTYRRKADAKRVAKQTETMKGGGKIGAYRCPHCGWFHVGHDPGSVHPPAAMTSTLHCNIAN